MPTFAFSWLDLVVVFLYVVFIVWLGLYLVRRMQTADDYFLAGRSLTWWLIGFSLFASNVSSSTLLGLASSAYGTGIAVYNYEWMATLVLIFFVVFILPFYLRTRVYTIPEFLERRFDGRARLYFSGLLIVLNILVDTAGALYAGALVLKILYPEVPIWMAVGLLGFLAGLYTVAGGLKAVVYTDAVQAVLLLLGALLVAMFSFQAVGSWEVVTQRVPVRDLSIILPADDPVLPWPGLVTGVFLLGFYFWCTNQFMVQRVLGARDMNHGRWGSLFAGLLKLPVLFIMVLPGIFARILYPPEQFPMLAANTDLIYPTLLFDLLPVGIRGLVITALVAAIMSSVDSTLNSASTLVTMDFIRRFKQRDSHALVGTGRWVTAVFMALAILWAPQIVRFPNLWTYLQAMLAYLSPPVVACFLMGIFWKRATRGSAFVGLLVGHLAATVFLVLNLTDRLIIQTGPLTAEQQALVAAGVPVLHFLYLPPILLVISKIAIAVASLLQPPPPPEVVKELTWSPEFFRQESRELADLPWYKNYRLQALGLLLLIAWILIWFR
jgi:SSS family solute:Na+ symporter